MLLRLLIAALIVLVAPAAGAQTLTLAGVVRDAEDGHSLPGATVHAEGTTLGTIAGPDGSFALEAPATVRSLLVSFVSYRTQTVAVATGQSPLEVRLVSAPFDLQPIVVSAGRHDARRAEVPLAIAALSAADLAATRPVLFSDALNRLPGVLVVNLGNEQHSMANRQPMSTRALYAYLEDGIPVRPSGLFNHNAPIELNMAGAERVEVVRGPGAAPALPAHAWLRCWRV